MQPLRQSPRHSMPHTSVTSWQGLSQTMRIDIVQLALDKLRQHYSIRGQQPPGIRHAGADGLLSRRTGQFAKRICTTEAMPAPPRKERYTGVQQRRFLKRSAAACVYKFPDLTRKHPSTNPPPAAAVISTISRTSGLQEKSGE